MIGSRFDLFVAILLRRRWVVAAFLCLCMALASAGAAMIRPMHTATALILIEPTLDPAGRPTLAAEPTTARINAEIEILRSLPVTMRALERLDALGSDDLPSLALRPEALAFLRMSPAEPLSMPEARTALPFALQGALQVERRGATPIIAVTARASRPEVAADIANAVAAAHIALQTEIKAAALAAAHEQFVPSWSATPPSAQPPDMRIVAPAVPGHDTGMPATGPLLILALLAGGLVVLAAVLPQTGSGRGLRSPSDLAQAVRAPEAAFLPHMEGVPFDGTSHADMVVADPLSSFSEGVRALRLMVQRALEGRPTGQMVVVTSASEGEGKTTTALALARAFDMADTRVLLVDADVRSASLHRHVDVPLEAGFEQVLAGEVDIADLGSLIRRDPLSGVSVLLNSGRSALPAERLFGGGAFADVLEAARSSFDLVIVDMPSAHWAGELAQILPHAGVAVVVARWGHTDAAALSRVMSRIREARAQVLPVLPLLTLSPVQLGRPVPRYEPGYSSG